MTYKDAVKDFERRYHELYNNRVDYWTGQLQWSSYVDYLCKEGEITAKQYNNWSTPFPCGKNLKPNKRTLEAAVYGY